MSISSIPAQGERTEDRFISGSDKPVSGSYSTKSESPIPGNETSKPSSGPRATLSIHPGSERRGLDEPAKQLSRRLFDRISAIVHRYSHEPLDKNEQGEYITSDEKVRKLLTQEIEELRKLDPMIPLLLELESKYQNQPVEANRLQVVSYKIINPSIKELNDVYLGPNQTDDYTEDLHSAIDVELSAHNAKLLNNHYKGGVFFVDHGPSNGHTPEQHAVMMQAHEERIKELAKMILIRHLEKRHDDLYERVADFSLGAITENQRQLKDLIAQLQANKEKIEIAFGFEDINANGKPIDTLASILNAEREANMIAEEHKSNKKNGRPTERKEARKYNHEKLMVELISATIELYQRILNGDGELKPEWSNFFKQTDTLAINMRKSMIQKYRKIDQFRESGEYREMSPADCEDFERKLKVFEDYYRKINLVDVLKKTTFENTDTYLARLQRIAGLIKSSESKLAEGKPDTESLRIALCQTSAELEVSLKDEGMKTVHTTRAAIKALMAGSGEEAIIAYGDNIGFAGLNQSGYENSVLSLIDSLGLTDEEIQSVLSPRTSEKTDDDKPPMNINLRKLRTLVRRKLRPIKNTPEFQQILLSVGDEGTRYLRDNQAYLSSAFNGKAIASADGGDEDIVVYTKANGCDIPDDPLAIERTMFNISKNAKIRIAVVYGDMSFTPMPDYDPEVGVTPEARFENVRHLKGGQFAEFGHRRIKAEARTKIEMASADKIMT